MGDGPNKNKDKGRSRTRKQIKKKEDDKMQTTAANVAARAAVGGDDMHAKWQFMADQAREKREASRCSSCKAITSRGLSAPSGGVRMQGRRSGVRSCPQVESTISTKDLIAVLEREPQMAKSTIIYRLHEKVDAESTME